MAPWLRIRRRLARRSRLLRGALTALVLVVGAVQPSYAAEPTPTIPAAERSRAGSLAGEGRERPGRAGVDGESGEVGPEDPTGTEADPGTATDPTDPTPARPTGNPYDRDDPDADSVARPGAGDGPVLRALPLGSGLILIGLGLGLAFVALRVRRS